ncbi:hypothetical protein BP00DRAFT_156867 [Aspergillus indologenus CBS 114.80]|uniref:Uncharacterized protein n=1 Tax=Aspergillus indologenus CBS 114.80 TaxID=1450541 RepID=A0A2V5JBA7_9EURO|nr:hypothetical protein BP00DRAFT_156867 [Aspergillus indologenus CBS 114.80]
MAWNSLGHKLLLSVSRLAWRSPRAGAAVLSHPVSSQMTKTREVSRVIGLPSRNRLAALMPSVGGYSLNSHLFQPGSMASPTPHVLITEWSIALNLACWTHRALLPLRRRSASCYWATCIGIALQHVSYSSYSQW